MPCKILLEIIVCMLSQKLNVFFVSLQFESLVRKADLVQFLQYSNTYTLFAPNDTAYDNLTPDRKRIVDDLTGTELENFVKFHISKYCK